MSSLLQYGLPQITVIYTMHCHGQTIESQLSVAVGTPYLIIINIILINKINRG